MLKKVGESNVRLNGCHFPRPITGERAYAWYLDDDRDEETGRYLLVEFRSEPDPSDNFLCDAIYTHPNGLTEPGRISPIFDELMYFWVFPSVRIRNDEIRKSNHNSTYKIV